VQAGTGHWKRHCIVIRTKNYKVLERRLHYGDPGQPRAVDAMTKIVVEEHLMEIQVKRKTIYHRGSI